jgi:hypothetical protein
MRKFVIAVLLCISNICFAQDVCNEGICIAEFNASFNEANKVVWLNKLSDCETDRVDITVDARWASEYKIVVVPTLVIFKDGEEVKRFQANIMMQMEATRQEVQDAIDEIVMEAF